MRLPLLLAIMMQCTAIALTAQNTNRLNSYDYVLAVNNIKVSLDPSGTIGYSNVNPYYFNAPSGGDVSAMYGGFFWLAGKDQFGEIRTFTPDWYGLESEVHFGPYNNKTATLSATELDLLYIPYNRVWLVTAAEIAAHKLQYNTPDYVIPESILNWPGNGDTASGFSAQLAPFADVNNNFIYEPLLGDYPLIKGDAAVFAMYHDNTLYEIYPYNKNMDIEVHVLMYAYEASPETFLDNTLFVDYTLFNRGDFNYDTLLGGSFVDFSIGCYNDDYCGSDSTLNLFYGYNGDLEDGPWDITYSTLPALGCMPLSHALHSFMNLTGLPDPSGYPDNSEEFYYSLDAKFGDGFPMTTGGMGYNTGSTSFTNYMFHGDVNNLEQWSEITESNTPSERRGVGSVDLGTLVPGGSSCASFAYVFADAGTTLSKTYSVDLLKTYSTLVHNFYDLNDTAGCLETMYIPLPIEEPVIENALTIYPNPATDAIHFTTGLDAGTSFEISLYQITGAIVYESTVTNVAPMEAHTIEVEHLPSGLYLLALRSQGSIKTSPVVIK